MDLEICGEIGGDVKEVDKEQNRTQSSEIKNGILHCNEFIHSITRRLHIGKNAYRPMTLDPSDWLSHIDNL
jgi:hypothetical protein